MRVSSVSSGWNAVARILPWRRPTTLPLNEVSTVAADPTSATNGPRMNTSGKSFSTMESEEISVVEPAPDAESANPGTRSPGSTKNGGIASSRAEIGGGGERAKLTAVRIASHDGVKRAKVNVRIIIQLAG